MATAEATYRSRVLAEIDNVPPEYLPLLIKMIQVFQESITLPAAEHSFQQGWEEAMADEVHPISELWEGFDG